MLEDEIKGQVKKARYILLFNCRRLHQHKDQQGYYSTYTNIINWRSNCIQRCDCVKSDTQIGSSEFCEFSSIINEINRK